MTTSLLTDAGVFDSTFDAYHRCFQLVDSSIWDPTKGSEMPDMENLKKVFEAINELSLSGNLRKYKGHKSLVAVPRHLFDWVLSKVQVLLNVEQNIGNLHIDREEKMLIYSLPGCHFLSLLQLYKVNLKSLISSLKGSIMNLEDYLELTQTLITTQDPSLLPDSEES